MPQKSEAEIRASLDAVIEDVEGNQRIYGWFAGNVGTLARETRNLTDLIESRFDQVDQRFKQVDQRFEQVDRRFDQLEERLTGFEANTKSQFGLVHDNLRKIDARIERLVGYIERDELKEKEPTHS